MRVNSAHHRANHHLGLSRRRAAAAVALLLSVALLPMVPSRASGVQASGPLGASGAVDYCLNGTGLAAGPADAYVLPVSQRDQLQSALDTYHVVRLQAGDYRGSLSGITLSSNQQLFGNPTHSASLVSTLPPITVAPGTTNAIVDRVATTQLTFPPSSQVTSQNCFMRIFKNDADTGSFVMSGATLDSNVFLDDQDTILADDSNGGSLTNNRFIGSAVSGNIAPSLILKGDAASSSDNNVFLAYINLEPVGDSIYLSNQKNFALIGLNAETWNQWGRAQNPAMITTSGLGTFRGIGFAGSQHPSTASYNTPAFDFGAAEVQVYNSALASSVNPGLIYESSNQRSSFANSYTYGTTDKASGATRFDGLDWGATANATINGASVTSGPPTSAQQAALRQMYANPQRAGQPWESPTFAPIPDPAGPNWASLCGSQDDTAILQNAIKGQGLVQLSTITTSNGNLGGTLVPSGNGARYFCISAPLLLGEGQGLIGAGMDKTAIIAKSNSVDMIKGTTSYPGPNCKNVHVTLADLTLEGGANGIHADGTNGAARMMWSHDVISHVTFRNMANAGIWLDGSCAIDGNFWDFDNFVGNKVGFLQDANALGSGGDTYAQSYLDKTTQYHFQYVNNGEAWDWGNRPGNYSNANVSQTCVFCLFQGNTQRAINLSKSLSTLVAGSVFINNGGNPTVMSNDYDLSLVGDTFQADANGSGAVLAGHEVVCEGCTFRRGASTTATITAAFSFGNPQDGTLLNSTSDMPLGTLPNGLLLNSSLGADPSLDQQGVLLRGGAATTFLPGTPNPVPQLLWGSAFSFSGATPTPPPAATYTPAPSTPTAATTATSTGQPGSSATPDPPSATPSGTTTLFATGFEAGQPQPSWTDTVDGGGYPAGGISNVGGICCGLTGPQAGVRNETAHTGSAALMYSGNDMGTSTSWAFDKVFDLTGKSLTVGPSTTLSYWIYPQSHYNSNVPISGNNSTCVALDLIFTDGTNLRDSGAVDQNGVRLHPSYQCGHLTMDTWNHVTSNIGAKVSGKTIARIDVGQAQPATRGGYRGYIDDISLSK